MNYCALKNIIWINTYKNKVNIKTILFVVNYCLLSMNQRKELYFLHLEHQLPLSKTLSSKVISRFPMMIKVTSLFCNICNQTFPNFSKKKIFYHQKYHQYIQHNCAQCDFISNNAELLEFHIRKTHLHENH